MFETADIRPVTTAGEYEAALARISTLMDAEYGTHRQYKFSHI